MVGRDPVQEAVDLVARGISRLVRLDIDPVPLLRQMADDVEGAKEDEVTDLPSAEIILISDYMPIESD